MQNIYKVKNQIPMLKVNQNEKKRDDYSLGFMLYLAGTDLKRGGTSNA
jgi:hypothetical protein